MKPRLSAIGGRMSELTGVRAILKDIQETLQADDGAGFVNLSAGNPLVLPEVDAMWRRYARELLDGPHFGEIVGRYGSSRGEGALIDAIADWFNRHYRWGLTRRNVLVTAGSQSLYFLAANAFGGDDADGRFRRIILPLCPDYTGFGGVALADDVVKTYKPTLDLIAPHRFKYRPDFDRLAIDERVGAVIFSRPCNPSGNVLTDEEVSRIVDLCAPHDVPVLIDSAYAPPFPNLVFTAMEPIRRENVIHCMSLSKAGLPGERIGIAIGSEQLIDVLEAFQANLSIHSSHFGQGMAARAIASGDLAHLSAEVIQPHYRRKLECLQAALDRDMPDVPWRLHRGEGSLFGWLWFESLPVSDLELYRELKRERVIAVPGSSFFPGLEEDWEHKHQCIRVSLTATEEEIERGVAALAGIVDRLYNGRDRAVPV